MKTKRIAFILIVALTALTGVPCAFATKIAANRPYVQSGPDGVFYARCIPKDIEGVAGTTDIYRVKSDGDELVDHYEWYAPQRVVLGWSPIAGKVAVLVLHRGEPTTPDKQVEFTLYLGGKLLKSWTTADLVKLGAELHADPATRGKRAEFQVMGCEQIVIPLSNEYAFRLRLSTGRDLFFNILTGEEYVPLGRDLDFKKYGTVVTPKPDAIDQLVAKLSTMHGLWKNGTFRNLEMPETTSPEQIVEQVFKVTGFDKGHVKEHKILHSRNVQIGDESYTAAEVQTDLGKKIVLFTAGGRWNRVYDADEPEKPKP